MQYSVDCCVKHTIVNVIACIIVMTWVACRMKSFEWLSLDKNLKSVSFLCLFACSRFLLFMRIQGHLCSCKHNILFVVKFYMSYFFGGFHVWIAAMGKFLKFRITVFLFRWIYSHKNLTHEIVSFNLQLADFHLILLHLTKEE